MPIRTGTEVVGTDVAGTEVVGTDCATEWAEIESAGTDVVRTLDADVASADALDGAAVSICPAEEDRQPAVPITVRAASTNPTTARRRRKPAVLIRC